MSERASESVCVCVCVFCMHFSVWDPQLYFEAINKFLMVAVSQMWLIIDSSREAFKIMDYLAKMIHLDSLNLRFAFLKF